MTAPETVATRAAIRVRDLRDTASFADGGLLQIAGVGRVDRRAARRLIDALSHPHSFQRDRRRDRPGTAARRPQVPGSPRHLSNPL
jgi:hypothetical protein